VQYPVSKHKIPYTIPKEFYCLFSHIWTKTKRNSFFHFVGFDVNLWWWWLIGVRITINLHQYRGLSSDHEKIIQNFSILSLQSILNFLQTMVSSKLLIHCRPFKRVPFSFFITQQTSQNLKLSQSQTNQHSTKQ